MQERSAFLTHLFHTGCRRQYKEEDGTIPKGSIISIVPLICIAFKYV